MSLDKFIQDGQDPKVVEKIYSKIEDMLTNGEAVKYVAMQKKPAVTLLPDCIVISNRRIFLCEFTKLGLSNNFEIFEWKDIKDIAFKEEIFGSKVTVIPSTGENLSIDYIPKTQARKLFQLIKDALESSKNENNQNNYNTKPIHTEKEVEKPIVLDIYGTPKEDANPVVKVQIPSIPTPTPEISNEKPVVEIKNEFAATPIPTPTFNTPTPTPVVEVEDEITIKLKKLKTLYDKQLITQSEYESKKADILEQL